VSAKAEKPSTGKQPAEATRRRTARELSPARKIRPVLRALDAHYGRKDHPPPADPLQVLVRGVLSQNTSDVNSGRAFRSLLDTFGAWQQLARARQSKIEAAIRAGGLARQKARTIRSVMRWLATRDGYSLDFLADMPSDDAERLLTSIKGVGVKTARLVLLFGLARPVFVVDTHVHRVTRRLALIPDRTSREKAHELLDNLVPDEDKYSGHMNMIQHGRRTCHARSPACHRCPVRRWCAFLRRAHA
jgi:endonuclease-3